MQKPWENKAKVLSMQEYRAFENVLEEKKNQPRSVYKSGHFSFFFFPFFQHMPHCPNVERTNSLSGSFLLSANQLYEFKVCFFPQAQ